ncbi:hypothetical protein SDC9_68240 [bioreactor metagenome]|uniref:HTH cro/C1-type domain-containing protein n=1 Tax=bioreactor metagenome TaxID=1076179 RepID=A0A644XZX4_9ZZZZ
MSKNIIDIFAANVKRYRLHAGISQEKLAELACLHRTYISAIECKRRNISIENIQKIADALEIDPYKLLIEENEDASKH